MLVIISALIGNIYVIFLNKKYDNLYNEIKDIKLVATIESEPIEKEYNFTYEVKIKTLNNSNKYKNTKLILKVKKEKNNIKYEYGSLVEIKGEFIEPTQQRNYKGFNYKEYLKTQKIYGTVISNKNEIKILAKNNVNPIFLLANKVKNIIIQRANELLPEKTANLFTGIIIGYKNNVQEEIIENFRISSLSHILAVSGAHVSYVILGIVILLQKINVGKRKANIITIIFIIIFMFITGFSPSVVRAGVMGCIMLGAKIFYRKQDFWTSISLSLLIILLENPFNILNIGLQLSYSGTIGIIIFSKKINEKLNVKEKSKIFQYIFNILIISLSAQIVILPITILHFNTISPYFLLSNLVATPILGITIILGFIILFISFIFIDIAKFLAIILNIILEILIQISHIVSELPFSNVIVITPYIIFIIIYYLFIFSISYIPYKTILKNNFNKIVSAICIIMITFSLYNMISKNLKINFIDVGQGDSSLIITPTNKKILIDGGGTEDINSYDVGKNILLPYLLDRKINSLDYIIISHLDSDHVRTDY